MLSEELVIDLAGLAPNRKVCASTCMTRKFDKKPCKCYPGMRTTEALEFARAIEAEVRKQDDVLILQLEEALTDIVEAGEEAWGKDRPCVRIGKEATTAARARLGEKT